MDSLNPTKEYNPFLNRKKWEPFTKEQLSYIKELADRGWNARKICISLGISSGRTAKNIKKRIDNQDWEVHEKKRDNALSQKELNEIKEKVKNKENLEQIAKEYSISLESLYRRIANDLWERPKKKSKFYADENYFDEIDTEHKAYWLGFLYADGYVTPPVIEGMSPHIGLEISTKDIELLKQFQKDLNTNYPIHIYNKDKATYKYNYPMARISICSKHMAESLAKWGIVPNKTFFLTFPDFLNEELTFAFIRGYIDGDGSIIINKNKYKTISICGTYEFLTGLKNFLKIDVKLSQKKSMAGKNNYTLSIRDNKKRGILDKIYNNCTICLERKF